MRSGGAGELAPGSSPSQYALRILAGNSPSRSHNSWNRPHQSICQVSRSASFMTTLPAKNTTRSNGPLCLSFDLAANFFAKNVIDYMGQSTELKDEPHREAAFRVLKSALVPSVLIELAYVSNKQDAANLKSEAWRDKVSNSIVGAINRYFAISRLPL